MRKLWGFWIWMQLVLISGCGGGGGSSPGAGPQAVDTIKPAIMYVSPANRDTGVGTNSTISVTFSEAMNPSSINVHTFTLTAQDGSAVPATFVVYDDVNRIAQFKSTTALNPNASYTATVAKEVTDESGNGLSTHYTWSFTTGSSDITAPTVVSHSPQGTDVPVNSQITAVFSETMDQATLGSTSFTLSAHGTAVPGSVSVVGAAAVFTPKSALTPNTTYTATVTDGVRDLAGNGMAAGYSWTFTTRSSATPDAAAPKILWTRPGDGEKNVSVKSVITVLFDKPIYPILIGMVDGNPTKIEIIYNADLSTEVRAIPTQDLKRGASYRSRIAPKDLSGNQMAPYVWEFFTEP